MNSHHPGTDPKGHPESECAARGCRPAQRQDSLHDQLRDLIKIANERRMYDAADYLTQVVAKTEPPNAGLTPARPGTWDK